MRAHHHHRHITVITLVFCCLVHYTFGVVRIQELESHRRILHQPLYPVSTAPPPEVVSPPPPPDSPDQPFFPEVPTNPSSDQSPPPPPEVQTNGSVPIPTATQPAKPTKKVAIAISVGIVTLGMLSALAFFLYRHRARHSNETQKLVGGDNSRRVPDESRAPPSTFLYIGTVEPANRRSVPETNVENGANGSPYHKLNSIKRSDRYRPSPELQPLPPLAKALSRNSVSAMSSSDEESLETSFHTPYGSVASTEDGYYTPVSRRSNLVNGHSSLKPARGEDNHHPNSSVPHSKRTSPRARLSASPPDTKLTMIPSMKQSSPPPLPPAESRINRVGNNQLTIQVPHQRPKFAAPPPPPNRALLQALSKQSPQRTNIPAPPPPPPPPPLPLFRPRKLARSESRNSSTPSQVSMKELSSSSTPKTYSTMESSKISEEANRSGNSLERHNSDEMDGGKAKLKPLHWDKVRATSDRATVWDQLKSSSFQLNEDMMETLFGCNSANSVQKEATRKSILPPVEHENRVLDPKKSQNIAILLRALNVTRDEVSDALLEGNPDSLGAELLETLVKMAPTKEEEIKLRDYIGDTSKLGTAERFLKTVLDIPFAFKRVEAMLYRANFDVEVNYLKNSFQTLEEASEELRSSRLFLKLLEAVLRTGNRMNVGTNRGDARAFKLDTLLKLVDIKGTDGKTTLLHFVVQEIIRSEGADTESTNESLQNKMNSKLKNGEFNKYGLQVVAGLSRDLGNVKKAAGMDSDVLSGYLSKLETGLDKVKLILQHERPHMLGEFFNSMKSFLKEAEEEIVRIKSDERKALSMVKEVTEYFHGDTAKEEAHPLRIFMIVRDFLFVLDHVCKEVGNMQDKAIVGAARSFRISSSASLPVLNRFNVRQESSDDESLSP